MTYSSSFTFIVMRIVAAYDLNLCLLLEENTSYDHKAYQKKNKNAYFLPKSLGFHGYYSYGVYR